MVAVAPIWRDHHAGILQRMVHPAHRVKRHSVKFTNSQEGKESYLGQFVSEVPFGQLANHHELVVTLEVVVHLGIGRADHMPGRVFRVPDQVNGVELGNQFLVHRIIKILRCFAFLHVFHLSRAEHFIPFTVDVDRVLIQIVNHRFNNHCLKMLAISDCVFLCQQAAP